jgi:hypothetical protein
MTINLRKNIARFIYILDQTTDKDSRAKILKELDITEDEFSQLVEALLDFSNSPDKKWYIVTPDDKMYMIENCEIKTDSNLNIYKL